MTRPFQPENRGRRRHAIRTLRVFAFVLLLVPSYALTAYVLLPASWQHCVKRIPQQAWLATYTAEGIPADPVNVAVLGTRRQLMEAMRNAGWSPADKITVRSGFRDFRSVLFNRAYPSAPVSTHFLAGRCQDLAFERTVGPSPRRRHHVRFWLASFPGHPERAIWMGAATFDCAIGVSSYTGEPTHHIDPQVDRERDTLLADLAAANRLERVEEIAGLSRAGRNGGGDLYETDGKVFVGVLR